MPPGLKETGGLATDPSARFRRLLALKIAGADLNGVTPTSAIKEAGVNGSAIAPAISYAVDKGAFVSSVSVNGVFTPADTAAAKAAMGGTERHDLRPLRTIMLVVAIAVGIAVLLVAVEPLANSARNLANDI